ncbi:MAG TPA: cyclase family protein [Alphaproteobacteria bacterium]|nr:cyclase family protein [Alphaproteobacteria bacterium]
MTDGPPEPHNWHRWGPEDELGALNLLTGAVVRSALASVRQGRILSLSLPIKGSTSSSAPSTVPHLKGRPLPQHFMSVDGADYEAGVKLPAGGRGIADDALLLSPHGTTTHMDALCHMWTGKQIYNGHPSSRIRSYGATRCGMEKVDGMVTRGVLFDIAAYRGMDVMDPTDRISALDLEAMSEAMGVTVGQGDAVVIRTGWPTVYAHDPQRYWAGEPGLSSDAAKWLAARDVSLVASDNSAISGLNKEGLADETVEDDIHMIFLWRHGIYLMEMLWLEELAKAAQPTFLLMVAPLKIVGGTGSPVNPLAVL